jgi:hypothetical protein
MAALEASAVGFPSFIAPPTTRNRIDTQEDNGVEQASKLGLYGNGAASHSISRSLCPASYVRSKIMVCFDAAELSK